MFRSSIFILSIFIVGFLAIEPSFSQEIKYSLGPECKNHAVMCPNPNEIPTCIVLNPRIHLELVDKTTSQNRYEPSCGLNPNNSYPGCVDISVGEYGNGFISDVTIECLEPVKCEKNNETNKLVTACSNGKIAKCLGGSITPNCESSSLCEDGSIPVCDYVWEAKINKPTQDL